ncbi:MAG: hypothetical protein JWQ72_2283 [Polaromonas sp.]|nr:hypothetical protein [Polaromonas sp.]
MSEATIPRQSKAALVLAWMVESVAVIMGLTLAIFAGIEGGEGASLSTAVAILPFAALSVIELTKIPLVGLCFSVRGWGWRLLAIAALLVVTFATFENFVFGFERGFAERLHLVEAASTDARLKTQTREQAQALIPALSDQQTTLNNRLDALSREIAAARSQAESDVTDMRQPAAAVADLRMERGRIDLELQSLEQRRINDIARERRRCATPEVRCNISPIEANYRRQRDDFLRQKEELRQRQQGIENRAEANVSGTRERRDREIAEKEREGAGQQVELTADRAEISNAQRAVSSGQRDAIAATHRLDELVAKSQLHRISAGLYGNHEPATLERTKQLFVVSLAAIVALIGTIIATMHYASQPRPKPSRPIVNALRGILSRLRRRLRPARSGVRMPAAERRRGLVPMVRAYYARRRRALALVPITNTVIRTVDRPVDRLKLVFLPLNATEDEIARARAEAKTGSDAEPAKVAA